MFIASRVHRTPCIVSCLIGYHARITIFANGIQSLYIVRILRLCHYDRCIRQVVYNPVINRRGCRVRTGFNSVFFSLFVSVNNANASFFLRLDNIRGRRQQE